jgi:outer membrane lipoprotein-sorting protein
MHNMKFMRVLVACAACLGAGTPVFAEKIPLAAIESYIESITTARGTFEQINPDKSRVTGQLILKRPWRARFDYDAPVNSSVIAAAGSLTIVDGKSDSKQVYPLNKTPLVHLLRPNVDLSTTTDVVAHTYNGRHTIVTMVDRNNLEAGQIHLVFEGPSPKLVQWIIRTGGEQTYVVLKSLDLGGPVSDSVFQEGR